MAITVKHVYLLSGQELDSTDRIKAAVAALIPTPMPTDTEITVGPEYQIHISFSIDHADANAAAADALQTMRGLPT